MAGVRITRLQSKLTEIVAVGRQLGAQEVVRDLRRWAWSEESFVKVRRTVASTNDPANRPELRARPLTHEEATRILSQDLDGAPEAERRLLLRRLRLTENRIGQPWLVECDGVPAYFDWFFGPADNPTIASFYGGLFQPLAADEILGESGYVFPAFRGRAIASAGLSLMAAGYAPPEATWLVAYIPLSNTRNLRNAAKNVFTIDAKVTVRWRVGRRTISVEPWTEPPPGGLRDLAAASPSASTVSNHRAPAAPGSPPREPATS